MRDRMWVLLIAAAVVLSDQVSKLVVSGTIPLGHRIPLIDGYLALNHVQNRGAAFGLFAEAPAGPRKDITIQLKYVGKVPVVSGLKRISKPGLRVYASKTEIPRVLGGLGVVVISTSQGIMTGQQARKSQLGGEVLAYVW